MSKKILVIDDEPDLINMIKFRLESNNYYIIEAYNGNEGFKKARDEKPDLIILDIAMPDVDGLKTLSKMKKFEEIKDIPVIMLTANSEDKAVAKALDLGAADYIVKPFDPVLLLEKIADILS